MHSKIINPKTEGKVVYSNRGTSAAVVAYLEHEKKDEKKQGQEDEKGIFFNQYEDGIDGQTVRHAIDNNVKGLRKDQEKFYSLIISPSDEELKHIGNDPEKLKEYTRQVMRNYAENFNLPKGKKIGEDDLVWYATVHQHRTVKAEDMRKQGDDIFSKKEFKRINEIREELSDKKNKDLTEARKKELHKEMNKIFSNAEERNMKKLDPEQYKVGDRKPGHNTHIHITVSARDAEMKHTLNPKGRKSTFYMKAWQIKNFESFQKMFGYEKGWEGEKLKDGPLTDKEKQRIKERIDFINSKYHGSEKGGKIDPEKANKIAEEHKYGKKGFFYNLNKMTHKYETGDNVRDPYEFMANGKDKESFGKTIADKMEKGFKNITYKAKEFGRNMDKFGDGLIQEIVNEHNPLDDDANDARMKRYKNKQRDKDSKDRDRGEDYER